MIKNRGIAVKLTLLILSSMTVIFAVIFVYNFYKSSNILKEKIEENAKYLTLAKTNQIDTVLNSIEKIPEYVAFSLESFEYERSQIIELARNVVKNNPDIYGAGIAFAPYAYADQRKRFAPYCFWKSPGELDVMEVPYDYFSWDWFQIPKELNRPVWSEPYFDEGAGNIIMATYSVPFYRNVKGGRQFMGVVTADISLERLQKIVESIQIEETGYGFLISKNGTFITHPVEELIMNQTIFSLAEEKKDRGKMTELESEMMRKLGRKMIRGLSDYETSFKSVKTHKECWLFYHPIPSNSWSLGVLFPRDELLADIKFLKYFVLFLGISGFLVIYIVIRLIAETITRPLRALSKATEDIGVGNLDAELPVIKSQDEVGRLSTSFASMQRSLKEYIEELKETTAAKERIESELKVARDIQMGILHKIFPPFPDREDFDIFATIEPAKEVGGDLYDFFFLDDDHLCFAVGDVSGKGVPAALFMAVSKTLIMTKATQGLTSEAVLTRVNEDLSLDNPSMMFVTLFLGILNIRTGELEYCNGGHNPPYILRKNGDVELIEMTGGMALGIIEDFFYQSKKVQIEDGDAIFLFTDGVTEATNTDEELFSEERLEKDLAELYEKPIHELINEVMVRIKAFAQGMPQADDITMMVLKYFGDKGQGKS
ncbi:SpoIIE family protein phosphatase [Thermodesulfobacteriota bacterium]